MYSAMSLSVMTLHSSALHKDCPAPHFMVPFFTLMNSNLFTAPNAITLGTFLETTLSLFKSFPS